MLEPAPGRFSITIWKPALSLSSCATTRASTSTPPPGAKPTTMVIFRFGMSADCANAAAGMSTASVARTARRIRMTPPALKSTRRQRVAEGLAHMRAVQAAVVALLRAAGDDLEAGEHRALLGQDRADLLLEDSSDRRTRRHSCSRPSAPCRQS
jgi:hypothetical protein